MLELTREQEFPAVTSTFDDGTLRHKAVMGVLGTDDTPLQMGAFFNSSPNSTGSAALYGLDPPIGAEDFNAICASPTPTRALLDHIRVKGLRFVRSALHTSC